MARWTPDEAYTLFLCGYPPQESDLWIFPEKTGFFGSSASEPERLTSGLQVIGFTFSPDGKKILVFRGDPRGELFSYGIALGRWVRYEFEPETSASYVDFSSDGQWVAYVKYPEMTLWYSRRDGTRKRQIKFDQRRASWPRWSPDSKHIAYSVTDAGITRLDKRVYLVSIEDGTPRRVLEEDYNQYSHCWSPDGTKLLISGLPEDKYPIKVVEISSGEVTELPASLSLASPEWSPDGRYIAALKREKLDDSQLVLFDISNQSWSKLDSCDYFGFSQWSADGQYLYYRKEGGIYRRQIEDRKIEKLATPSPIRTDAWEPWWRLDPDGNLLILRNISKTEIFALDFEAP